MKVRARHDLMAHHKTQTEDIFIDKKAGEDFDINNIDLLKAIANEVEILDHYPPQAEYKFLKDYRGNKAGDIIPLFSDQAGKLVLRGVVEPVNEKLWAFGRELPKSSKSFLRRVADALI